MDATFHVEQAVFNYRAAAVMIADGKILLHRQWDHDYWALPGGRVEVLEDSASCVPREVKEELGFDVQVDRLLWFVEGFFVYEGKDFHELSLYYLVSPIKGQFDGQDEPFHGEEGDRLIYWWAPIDQLDDITLYPQFLKTELEELPETPQHKIIKRGPL